MGFAGVAISLAGFVIAVASLGISESNGARLGIVLAGIVVSLFGSLGVINPYYQKNAPWKK